MRPPEVNPPDPPPIVQQAADATEETAENVADATEEIIDEVTQTGQETQQDAQQGAEDTRESAEDTGADLRHEISRIGQSAENTIGETGRQALRAIDELAQDFQDGLPTPERLLSVVQSVLLIVVAVVVSVIAVMAAVWSGGGTLLVIAIVTVVLQSLAGQSTRGVSEVQGEAQGVSSNINVVLRQILVILRRLELAPDKKSARRVALREISNAMVSLERTTVTLRKTSGRCGGDMRADLLPLHRVEKSLAKLLIFLRRGPMDAKGNRQAAIFALERVHRVLADTTGALQSGVARLNQLNLQRGLPGGQKAGSTQSQSSMRRGAIRQGVNPLEHGLPPYLKRRK